MPLVQGGRAVEPAVNESVGRRQYTASRILESRIHAGRRLMTGAAIAVTGALLPGTPGRHPSDSRKCYLVENAARRHSGPKAQRTARGAGHEEKPPIGCPGRRRLSRRPATPSSKVTVPVRIASFSALNDRRQKRLMQQEGLKDSGPPHLLRLLHLLPPASCERRAGTRLHMPRAEARAPARATAVDSNPCSCLRL